MHIAFAVLFFIFVGLSETLRHGVFGLSPSETTAITYVAMVLAALVILRSDVVFVLRRPTHSLYGSRRLNWSWRRTALGLCLAPAIGVLPGLYGLAQGRIDIAPMRPDLLAQAILGPSLVLILAQELFLREAVIKAYAADRGAIYLISVLATFIYHMPLGAAQAAIAAGTGMFFLTLRLIGTNIVAVAVLHSATLVVFAQVLSPDLAPTAGWAYAAWYLGGAAVISLILFRATARHRRLPLHA